MNRIEKRTFVVWILTIVCALIAAVAMIVPMRGDTVFAAVGTDHIVRVKELLAPHYDQRTDSKMFDRSAMDDLYSKLGGSGATFADLSTLAATGQTALDIRGRNGGNDVFVKLGGREWMVTHLTTDRSGNVIATLWEMNTSGTKYQYNEWADESNALAYPSHMYSTSSMRSKVLNNSAVYVSRTDYAAGRKNTLTNYTPSVSHPYADFTVDKTLRKTSVTEYLVTPSQVAYQQTESVSSIIAWNYDAPNDAYGNTIGGNGFASGFNYEQGGANAKAHYGDWANDYLWLPSTAEIGYTEYPEQGLWKINPERITSAGGIWLRSGSITKANNAYALDSDGMQKSVSYAVTEMYELRPAVHLNLSKAETSGTATAVTVPTIGMSGAIEAKDYNGDAQTFALRNFDKTAVDVQVTGVDPAGKTIADGFSFDADTGEIQATKAGTYTVRFQLHAAADTYWDSGKDSVGERTLTFRIDPKTITVDFVASDGLGWIWSVGTQGTITATPVGLVSGESVKLKTYYYYQTNSDDIESVVDNVLDISRVTAIGQYTLCCELDGQDGSNANYKIASAQTRTFTVEPERADLSNMKWQYTADGKDVQDATAGMQLPYRWNEFNKAVVYELSVTGLPDYVTVDLGDAAYPDGYQNRSGSVVKPYETKALLRTDKNHLFDGKDLTKEVTISWSIVKGVIDLSDVKWGYSYYRGDEWIENEFASDAAAELQYNDGNPITVRVKSLPYGIRLKDSYVGDVRRSVGGPYTATVEAQFLDYEKENFDLIHEEKLQFTWSIVKRRIPVDWEEIADKTAEGRPYYRWQIKSAHGANILYEYTLDGDSVGENDAGVAWINAHDPGTDIYTYTVRAYLSPSAQANYILEGAGGGDPSVTFRVGDGKQIAIVKFVGDLHVVYDGQAQFLPDAFTVIKPDNTPMLSTDYTVAYYRDDAARTPLADGEYPIGAGKYQIEIRLSAAAAAGYTLDVALVYAEIDKRPLDIPVPQAAEYSGKEIDCSVWLPAFDAQAMALDGVARATRAGDYQATLTLRDTDNYVWADGSTQALSLDWTIRKARLPIQWYAGDGTPTFIVPNAYASVLAIEYEYSDESGNPVAAADLQVGQRYRVTAKFPSDHECAGNFVFDDGSEEGALSAVSESFLFTGIGSSDSMLPGGADAQSVRLQTALLCVITAVVIVMAVVLCVISVQVGDIRRYRKREYEDKRRERRE